VAEDRPGRRRARTARFSASPSEDRQTFRKRAIPERFTRRTLYATDAGCSLGRHGFTNALRVHGRRMFAECRCFHETPDGLFHAHGVSRLTAARGVSRRLAGVSPVTGRGSHSRGSHGRGSHGSGTVTGRGRSRVGGSPRLAGKSAARNSHGRAGRTGRAVGERRDVPGAGVACRGCRGIPVMDSGVSLLATLQAPVTSRPAGETGAAAFGGHDRSAVPGGRDAEPSARRAGPSVRRA
jgi:hypothetical protein